MAVTTPGRLEVASDGRITGPAHLTYNTPFPCVNGSYGSGAIHGVVMHTMVGQLAGTIEWFNNPQAQASAHFGIGQDGSIHQFGPIGKGWCAWAQAAGNKTWYSIEHADNGNPGTPLASAQVIASAQLLEVLSRFAGFPLQVTDSPAGKGYGTHVMGGAAWGGHTCPGPGPRAGQRAQIVALAMAIRAPGNEAFDMASFTEEQLTAIIQKAVETVETRNVLANATLWWLDKALSGVVPPTASPGEAALIGSIQASLVRLGGKPAAANPAPASS